MGRRKTTPKRLLERFAVAEDLVSLRRKLFGDRGAEEMARILGLSTRTWHNFEHGCLVPAEVVLKLLTLFPREASFGPLLDMKEPAHLAGASRDTRVGFPGDLIERTGAVKWYSCFISHSAADKLFVERLYADLVSNGAPCWYAPEDLEIGARIRKRIDELIRSRDKLLVVLSANAIESGWVEKEVETAMEVERKNRKTVLLPIRIDDSVGQMENGWAADIRRQRNIGDFRCWTDTDSYKRAFNRLLKDLSPVA